MRYIDEAPHSREYVCMSYLGPVIFHRALRIVWYVWYRYYYRIRGRLSGRASERKRLSVPGWPRLLGKGAIFCQLLVIVEKMVAVDSFRVHTVHINSAEG